MIMIGLYLTLFLLAAAFALGRCLFPMPDHTEWEEIGLRIINGRASAPKGETDTIKLRVQRARYRMKHFKAFFGVHPKMCCTLWFDMACNGHMLYFWQAQPKHMLWALLLLKHYKTDKVNCSRVRGLRGIDEKTFNKWAWHYAKGIAKLLPKYVSEIDTSSAQQSTLTIFFFFLLLLLLSLLLLLLACYIF